MKLSALWRLFQPNLTARDAAVQPAHPPVEMANDRLATAALGQPCEVVAIHAPAGSPDWARWLSEIGFIPGESARRHARSGQADLPVRPPKKSPMNTALGQPEQALAASRNTKTPR